MNKTEFDTHVWPLYRDNDLAIEDQARQGDFKARVIVRLFDNLQLQYNDVEAMLLNSELKEWLARRAADSPPTEEPESGDIQQAAGIAIGLGALLIIWLGGWAITGHEDWFMSLLPLPFQGPDPARYDYR